jgi:hypothetical protein
MAETTADVRKDIELTRTRISETLQELEQKMNVAQVVKNNPWPALALAVGGGRTAQRIAGRREGRRGDRRCNEGRDRAGQYGARRAGRAGGAGIPVGHREQDRRAGE